MKKTEEDVALIFQGYQNSKEIYCKCEDIWNGNNGLSTWFQNPSTFPQALKYVCDGSEVF